MFRSCLALLVLLMVVARPVFAADNEISREDREAGWILLFDGKSIDGWKRSDGKPCTIGVDREAINPHRCGAYMMVHEKDWRDFELSLDFKVSPGCNSGIFVRTFPLTPREGKDVGYNGIEVAIDDSAKTGYHATGAIYDLSPVTVDATHATGSWNHIVVICNKGRITVDLNGKRVNSIDLDKFTEPNKRPDGTTHKFDVAYNMHPRHGYIGLQDHGSPCWYKNIRIRPIE